MPGDLDYRPGGHDQPPFGPSPRSEIDQPVCRPDHLDVVLDHNHRVALIAQGPQGVEQLGSIAGMQSRRRFIEHIADPDQSRPKSPRESGPLQLPPRQRLGGSVETQVAKSRLLQKLQPGGDLAPHSFQQRVGSPAPLFPRLRGGLDRLGEPTGQCGPAIDHLSPHGPQAFPTTFVAKALVGSRLHRRGRVRGRSLGRQAIRPPRSGSLRRAR